MGELIDSVAWRDDAAYVRVLDVGAPMLVIDAQDRIEEVTAPAQTLLAQFEFPCERGARLPSQLSHELQNALLGDAIMWRPRGEGGPIVGSTRYRLGDRRYLLLMREITEQQRAITQRLHQQRLEETGKLAAHIAHELRTPLTSIMYNADVLSGRDLGPNNELIAEILAAAKTLRQTIAGVLDFVRLGPPINTTLSLREMCDRVQGLLRPMFRAGRHELVVGLHDEHIRIVANPMKLEQIFVNLVVNAVEAANGAGVPARIHITSEAMPPERVRTWRARDVVLLHVSDEGPGIPPERRESVFEAFVTSKSQGTGLGLTIAREAAMSVGGTVVLEDSAVGCRFGVVLPVVAPAGSAP